MKYAVMTATLFAASLALSGQTMAQGMKVGQDATALEQTRISNAGGGAGPNPHWGADPAKTEDDIRAGRNKGEAFFPSDGHYLGYAPWGEQGAWDKDPGNSGAQEHGGNAMN